MDRNGSLLAREEGLFNTKTEASESKAPELTDGAGGGSGSGRGMRASSSQGVYSKGTRPPIELSLLKA